jgi:putative DNA primase/helicase
MQNQNGGTQAQLEPNIDESVRYLEHLDEDADSWTLQTFHDGEGSGPDDFHAHCWQDSLQESAKKLQRDNNLGGGIYLTANRIEDGSSRKKANVKRIRCVYADLDGAPLEPVYQAELEPHLIVETSPGRYHIYWFVEPGLNCNEFEDIQSEIARRFDGDDVKTPERVVRLPGFYNRKDLEDDPRFDEPFQVRIHEENQVRRYTPDEIREAFKPEPDTHDLHTNNGHTNGALTDGFELPDEIEKGERNNTLTQYAGKIWTDSTSRDELVNKLEKVNEDRCSPPLDDEELEKIADSAERNFDPVPEPGDSDFSPKQFARHVVREERARGVLYARVVEQGTFYRYSADSGVWTQEDPEFIKGKLRYAGLEKRHSVNEVFEAFKHEVRDREHNERFDPGESPDKDHINFENGVLDWRTGDLKGHDPARYDQVQIPHEFDPDADCPQWRDALEDWINEEETRQFLQEYVGYCLIPDASRDRYVILTGTGKNGKSTFLEVIQELFGPDNCEGVPFRKLTDKAQFETKHLMGKLVNICAEIDANYIERTGPLKKIAAGEQLRGEHKHGKSFDFTPFCRLFFAANELPKARDKSEAWYRRMEVVPFPNRFDPDDPETDTELSAKLAGSDEHPGEIPGIINWAIEGLRRLEERGHFQTSDAMAEQMDKYQRKNDSVLAFVDDRLSITADTDDRVPAKALYRFYEEYCENAGLSPVAKNKMGNRLQDELSISTRRPWVDVCKKHGNWRCPEFDCEETGDNLEEKRRKVYVGVQYDG